MTFDQRFRDCRSSLSRMKDDTLTSPMASGNSPARSASALTQLGCINNLNG